MNEKGLSTIGPSTSLRMTVYASLMAALTAAGAFLAIPIGPVPIVLQNLFIFLSGLLLVLFVHTQYKFNMA